MVLRQTRPSSAAISSSGLTTVEPRWIEGTAMNGDATSPKRVASAMTASSPISMPSLMVTMLTDL